MKSLGTITMHFPFVDDKTRATLESIMMKAYNYADFVNLLCNRVAAEEESSTLIFLAFLHSRNICYIEGIETLSRTYGHQTFIAPFSLYCSSCRSETQGWNDIQRAVDEALKEGLDDWLIVEMNSLKISAGLNMSHWGLKEEQALDMIVHLIKSNEDLSCYAPYICYINSSRHIDEANREMAIKSTMRGIELAESTDDRVLQLNLYRQLAVSVEESDLKKAVEYLRAANKILDSLGESVLEATILSHIGRLLVIRGEFTGALEAYLEAIRISESLGIGLGVLPYSVAHIYNILGDANEAREWSKMALETLASSKRSLACAHTQMARALTCQGQLADAKKHLKEAGELALSVGNEAILALYEIAEGALEEAEGLDDDAYQSYERAVEIIERYRYPIELNDCALQLARLEVQRISTNATNDYSTLWLDQLEEITREKDYPGILGLALLLKAELRFKQQQRNEAIALVEEVGNMAQHTSLKFLSDKIADLLSVVDQIKDA